MSGRAEPSWEVSHPYEGFTLTARHETVPRPLSIHVLRVDLRAPGLRFKVTLPGGTLHTVRQTTLDFLNQEGAQAAVNAHYYLPGVLFEHDAKVVGAAASEGVVYAPFAPQPVEPGYPDQSYAILAYAPALNLDAFNRAAIVHRDPAFRDGLHVLGGESLYNTVAGCAQVIVNGVKTIPNYSPGGGLRPIHGYSNNRSWYTRTAARTLVGLTAEDAALVIFTVDKAKGSRGMTVGEAADLLIRDYGVWNALNLDGGPSTALAVRDPASGLGRLVNTPEESAHGNAVGSNLAIFAEPESTGRGGVTLASPQPGVALFTWPVRDQDWRLEGNDGLDPAGWRPVESSPVSPGRVRVDAGLRPRFYRLRKP